MATYTVAVEWTTSVDAANQREALKVAEARLGREGIDTELLSIVAIAPDD